MITGSMILIKIRSNTIFLSDLKFKYPILSKEQRKEGKKINGCDEKTLSTWVSYEDHNTIKKHENMKPQTYNKPN